MHKSKETLVHRFWSHVFTKPDSTSVLIKNEGPGTKRVVASGAGMRPGMAFVVDVPPAPLRPLSFRHVGHIVAEFMGHLNDNGFQRGDRVAILSWNRPEWVWLDLAVQSVGGITVPIYPNSSPEQVSYIIKDAGAKFLFAEDDEQLARADATFLG